jgi:hypothetical protein
MELIDTDVLIDIQRGFGAAADWFATDPDVGIPGLSRPFSRLRIDRCSAPMTSRQT